MEKVKHTGWVNVYPSKHKDDVIGYCTSFTIYPSRTDALIPLLGASKKPIDTIKIEWEE